ncbi:MAG: CsbD family protein [Synechococcaceae cyanobacterium RM1_1_27]|nr:CsbD family protein [Synechococcaceae cyanobacterium SM2_3_2]NJO85356.1 CsbD family protein [Synechococcaceae cyanobacterium RM1_1_27]
MEERIKAAAKNIEGKVQAATGELTGDQRQKVEGQAKQAEARAMNAKEDVRDTAKDVIDNVLD